MTLKLPWAWFGEGAWSAREGLQSQGRRMLCIEPDGSIAWQATCYQTLRSDTHQVVVYAGASHLTVCGSPARLGQPDNVFGSGDPLDCAGRMVGFVAEVTGLALPQGPEGLREWSCSRIDVTQNYALPDADAVTQALETLARASGGRLRAMNYGSSVYWQKGSRLRSGKAYSKGQHLRHLAKGGKAIVSPSHMELAQRLLRLELKLAAQWWRERSGGRAWYDFTAETLSHEHADFFGFLESEVITEHSIFPRLLMAAKTEKAASAAWCTWCAIQVEGVPAVRRRVSRATWYRHVGLLRAAGLGIADVQAGEVLPFRVTRPLLASPVSSWSELSRLAA